MYGGSSCLGRFMKNFRFDNICIYSGAKRTIYEFIEKYACCDKYQLEIAFRHVSKSFVLYHFLKYQYVVQKVNTIIQFYHANESAINTFNIRLTSRGCVLETDVQWEYETIMYARSSRAGNMYFFLYWAKNNVLGN